ncbi:hypothetical protein RKE29_19085 [Streptomyces sp. B1866]|uniref:hypothetical protein n=1 Tax=Streptomyces sp. B1866 TaxID=3075431 RepID=UPI00288F7ABD|nr:hypothetical protein [Streptomyces sp. B1866]MDT3398724.1 hypothetical protein [Streptomyces sp. B1866]
MAEFPVSDVPPIESAYWLLKPVTLVRGTWEEAAQAAAWLGRRLAEFAPRFASAHDRDPARIDAVVASAAGRLAWGGDMTCGYYLGQAQFLSVSVVVCSTHRAVPRLACPVR